MSIMPGPERRPSQRQIATSAGVSVSTVSRALSKAPGISDDLRRRIVKLAGEMGYGRTAATGEAARVALLVPLDLFSRDAAGFHQAILKGAEEELKAEHASLEIVFVDGRSDQGRSVEAHCAAHPGTGVLLVTLDSTEAVAATVAACCPAVIVNGHDEAMRVSGVSPANGRGARLAAHHLLALGHRRIAVVTSRDRSTLAERYEGFRAALDEAGGAHGPELLIELPRLHPDLAFAAMQARLARRKLDCTAIFCGNDLVAVGVLRALAEQGIAVPGQCSVMGFDDMPLAALSRPRLTTVRVDCEAIGRLSARHLLQRMRDPATAIVDLRLGCQLVARDSTAPTPSPSESLP